MVDSNVSLFLRRRRECLTYGGKSAAQRNVLSFRGCHALVSLFRHSIQFHMEKLLIQRKRTRIEIISSIVRNHIRHTKEEIEPTAAKSVPNRSRGFVDEALCALVARG